MSLRLDAVSAGYDGSVVVRDVTIEVPDNAVVALLGPNGAGKTTLLRTASGLLPPVRGTVHLSGIDLTGMPTDAYSATGITLIPEGRGVFPSLSVRENLRLFGPADGLDEAIERATEAFPRLGQRLDHAAGTLSGGEQQMLALARAFVRPTRVVLLDEVSMGLAPKLIDEIYCALADLARRGTSLLLVEQFAAKALSISDLVYVVAGGRIAFAGEPCELDDAALSSRYFGHDEIGEQDLSGRGQ